jgi:radical SAM enzyme (TIGR01210 family)
MPNWGNMSDAVSDRPLADQREELASYLEQLYDLYGQRKEMGKASPAPNLPHFFLLRTFLGENDLLVILNTKRCRYQCAFCTLTAKSSRTWIVEEAIVEQFRYVADEMRHALSIIDRVTLSNEGSILDESTFSPTALDQIFDAISRMRRVRRIEIETRMEFVTPERLRRLSALIPRAHLGILAGFETVNERIRDKILKKQESLPAFLSGLDRIAQAGASLTAYILYKPDPGMTDTDASEEATASIRFLTKECANRNLPLSIRLNPMYLAVGSRWAKLAAESPGYLPPRLTGAMRVAEEETQRGVPVYIGLSSEGLAGDGGSYLARDDYHPILIKYVKLFNDRRIDHFPWDIIMSAAHGQSGS